MFCQLTRSPKPGSISTAAHPTFNCIVSPAVPCHVDLSCRLVAKPDLAKSIWRNIAFANTIFRFAAVKFRSKTPHCNIANMKNPALCFRHYSQRHTFWFDNSPRATAHTMSSYSARAIFADCQKSPCNAILSHNQWPCNFKFSTLAGT